MSTTAKVTNARRRVILDGGGLVTLNGQGRRRILYMDTCDPAQVWTTSHCQDQAFPKFVVQNLIFADGNSTGQRFDGGGGGAIFVRGGQLRIVTPCSSATDASVMGRTSEAGPCGRCLSTAPSPSTLSTAASPPTHVATAAR
jgi:hypothetical protein